jgi:hypothetical protein
VGKARKETAGKANQFPLMAGTARATAETGEASEAALLLDPTGDEPPEKHLEFLRNGTVRAAKVNGVESERGRVTIDVVALLRRGLVEARERAAGETEVAIQHVRDTMKDISDISQMKGIGKKERAAKLAELEARLARNVADIDEKTAPDKHYTAVTGAMVRAFKAEVGLP